MVKCTKSWKCFGSILADLQPVTQKHRKWRRITTFTVNHEPQSTIVMGTSEDLGNRRFIISTGGNWLWVGCHKMLFPYLRVHGQIWSKSSTYAAECNGLCYFFFTALHFGGAVKSFVNVDLWYTMSRISNDNSLSCSDSDSVTENMFII